MVTDVSIIMSITVACSFLWTIGQEFVVCLDQTQGEFFIIATAVSAIILPFEVMHGITHKDYWL